jgi:hypothetical protein
VEREKGKLGYGVLGASGKTKRPTLPCSKHAHTREKVSDGLCQGQRACEEYQAKDSEGHARLFSAAQVPDLWKTRQEACVE